MKVIDLLFKIIYVFYDTIEWRDELINYIANKNNCIYLRDDQEIMAGFTNIIFLPKERLLSVEDGYMRGVEDEYSGCEVWIQEGIEKRRDSFVVINNNLEVMR
jgi:hypothetical protein